MKKTAQSHFTIKSWDDTPYEEGKSDAGHATEYPFSLEYEWE